MNSPLCVNNQNIEVVDNTKLLETVLTNDLKWDTNTNKIVKSANARMQILHKISSFGASLSDMKIIYFLFINSLLEQSSEVWHSSLTEENIQDLECIQKSAIRIILNKNECSVAATGPPIFEGPPENPKSLSSSKAEKFDFLFLHSVLSFTIFQGGYPPPPGFMGGIQREVHMKTPGIY